jgi:hypothetical protein
VICIDAISAPHDIVRDGGQILQSLPNALNLQRRAVYYRVLQAVLQKEQLQQPVRLVPSSPEDAAESTFGTLDWRAVQMGNAWIIGAVQSGEKGYSEIPCRLETDFHITSVTDLISGKKLDPSSLKIGPGPVLLRVEM